MYGIHFRTKVGWSNVLLIKIWWSPEIDQNGQNYDTFFVKFDTTTLDSATLLTLYTESDDW